MLFFVLRKILHNKGLIAYLLLGSILVVGMVASIPMYSDSVSQRMFTEELTSKADAGQEIGKYHFSLTYSNGTTYAKTQDEAIKDITAHVNDTFIPAVNLPVTQQTLHYLKAGSTAVAENEAKTKASSIRILGMVGWQDKVNIIRGRMPEPQTEDGTLEALVMEEAQFTQSLLMDTCYVVDENASNGLPPLRVRVVGIYQAKDESDPWWSVSYNNRMNCFLVDDNTFLNAFSSEDTQRPFSASWSVLFDYKKMKVQSIDKTLRTFSSQKAGIKAFKTNDPLFVGESVLRAFPAKETLLRNRLWLLQVPILIMLGFYIFMVSSLIIENDRKEISVLISRGFGRWQIFNIHLLHSSFMALIALVVGPFLGMLLCKLLGVSQGFLNFSSRIHLPLSIQPHVFLYAFLAALLLVMMMVFPALSASKLGIVEYKQKKMRTWNVPLWQKFFLDVLFLGVAFYGRYSYAKLANVLAVSKAANDATAFDPTLFLIFICFVIGAGLLYLRLFPYIIRGIHWLGRKLWPPVAYTTFIQVGRSRGKEQFVILFMVMMMSIGLFSSNVARTYNTHTHDTARYQMPVDIAVAQFFQGGPLSPDEQGKKVEQFMMEHANDPSFNDTVLENYRKMLATTVTYTEPYFPTIAALPGITDPTRVYTTNSLVLKPVVSEVPLKPTELGTIVAIDPAPYSAVVWSNNHILPTHINNYINQLALHPNGVILSQEAARAFRCNLGENIKLRHSTLGELDVIVYGIVEGWPGISLEYEETRDFFAITNIDYAFSKWGVQPYEVWANADPQNPATPEQVRQYADDNDIMLRKYETFDSVIAKALANPMVQDTNGAMTMGFVVVLAVSLAGFLLYWILSIRGRTLQFGVFRAMGMTKKEVFWMLIMEQGLISLLGIIVGATIGIFACDLFVPLLQNALGAASMPPFYIVTLRSDYIRLYILAAAILLAGIGILQTITSRIRIDQALKLGED